MTNINLSEESARLGMGNARALVTAATLGDDVLSVEVSRLLNECLSGLSFPEDRLVPAIDRLAGLVFGLARTGYFLAGTPQNTIEALRDRSEQEFWSGEEARRQLRDIAEDGRFSRERLLKNIWTAIEAGFSPEPGAES